MQTEKVISLDEKMLQRGRTPKQLVTQSVLVVSEIPMVLTLEQLRPNPDNPRTARNPKYDEIKASIRARGLDSVPKVTKDPDCADDIYIFSDGGNTRYAILTELYAETGDKRFHSIQCIVKPWPGRLQCMIGHLAENDIRGELSFIDKAFGIKKTHTIYEEQLGREVSQRELSELLKNTGYPVHHSNISRMFATIEYLYPWIPNLLNSGMGRPQITQLIALRALAEKAWKTFTQKAKISPEQSFNDVFGQVCHSFDNAEYYSIELLKDDLITSLLEIIPDPTITYENWLIELSPKTQSPSLEIISPSIRDDYHQENPPIKQSEKSKAKKRKIKQELQSQVMPVVNELEPVTDIWHISALHDDIEHLQDIAFRLAFELAEVMGIESTIQENKSALSAGFSLTHHTQNGLFVALSGDESNTTLVPFMDALIGNENLLGEPLFDDAYSMKFLRLIRIIRRLRELQRKLSAERNE
ncbi:TPA: ParB family protein [Proteus mirabilis]|uniref:ParB family protein n=1 Tax=Proteus mirabilis TaxID=584 RepID=UPI00162953A1|nr:ParB family protein [Proteus mirabilis]MBB6683743.1 ParB N-terminal domain-containing protein [Proteus mirabilis]MBG2989673.1 ParB N-terminal domain-containing protein [Proteus mirabilis]HEJ9673427.1 ParB N-terminal domain-containing protein [Proteus mirabilis]HEK1098768.1 ParB N-terminal domain-containing protein [Proteus mirabilis]HEK2728762.1 ParB N-terminal domain-containing protein [Proteus mirabilis]